MSYSRRSTLMHVAPPCTRAHTHTRLSFECPALTSIIAHFPVEGERGGLVRWGGLEQRAGGAAGQRGGLAVGGAGSHRQHVIVTRNVAVPGKVIRVLGVTGEPGDRHGNSTLDNADGRLWRREPHDGYPSNRVTTERAPLVAVGAAR